MAGRPRGIWKDKAWRDSLRLAALRPADEIVKPKTKLDMMALALVDRATAGDVPAIKEIGERLDGKVPQAVTGQDGGPVAMAISWQQ